METKELTKEEYKEFKEYVKNGEETKEKEEKKQKWLLKLCRRSEMRVKGKIFYLHDARVNCFGPDDRIYAKGGRVLQEITRGCVLIEWYSTSDNSFGGCVILQGFVKFSGLTDEDDDDVSKLNEEKGRVGVEKKQSENDVFFDGEKEDSDSIVEITKENGKAAHFGAFKVDGEVFFVCGSKNFHHMFRNKDDLILSTAENKKKKEEERSKYNKTEKTEKSSNIKKEEEDINVKVCFDMLDQLEDMGKERKEKFVNFLCDNGAFANFEYLMKADSHIVNYDFPKGKDYILRFLAFTGRRVCSSQYRERFGKCFPVEAGLKFAKEVGLEIPEYFVHKNKDKGTLLEIVERVRNRGNSEGSVLYFQKGEKTIGLCKTKSTWYIMFRAIREKLKRQQEGQFFDVNIQKRFEGIKTWLRMSDAEIQKWRLVAHKFSKFSKPEGMTMSEVIAKFMKDEEKYFESLKDETVLAEEIGKLKIIVEEAKKIYWLEKEKSQTSNESTEEKGWKKSKKMKKKEGKRV